ncbi:GNAT family protein [Arthrobacter burdickii]|uniref:GNAT family N-acetyltransferase n=1 Tax=Arthrobacter burdickii TaxID=3035920 RepID=A0ABT8JWX7_9MICC|nr:GNAT family N-acetyltransferase [Arthrobacter burdickii]MDN4609589.1 GNAT family N-acetyltransferase [Arthrobacter burdickii]
MSETVKVKRHDDLTGPELVVLQQLFDNEYLGDYGQWNADAPYGYSPANFHVLGFQGTVLAAHVGFQRRIITVGAHDVLVAGTGGVLVDKHARGTGFGGRVIRHAAQVMRDKARVNFGFLGCRQEVAPFYESAGWIQVHSRERCLSRLDQTSVLVSEGEPHLICSATRDASQWPQGNIDLRGTPW